VRFQGSRWDINNQAAQLARETLLQSLSNEFNVPIMEKFLPRIEVVECLFAERKKIAAQKCLKFFMRYVHLFLPAVVGLVAAVLASQFGDHPG
jgi:hypothetical protein